MDDQNMSAPGADEIVPTPAEETEEATVPTTPSEAEPKTDEAGMTEQEANLDSDAHSA